MGLRGLLGERECIAELGMRAPAKTHGLTHYAERARHLHLAVALATERNDPLAVPALVLGRAHSVTRALNENDVLQQLRQFDRAFGCIADIRLLRYLASQLLPVGLQQMTSVRRPIEHARELSPRFLRSVVGSECLEDLCEHGFAVASGLDLGD